MGFYDDLQRQLGLGGEEEPLMVPPPPDEKAKRALEFAKEQEPAMQHARDRALAFANDQAPAMQHGHDAEVRQLVQQALDQGRHATIPPPPAPPPPLTPDQESPEQRRSDALAAWDREHSGDQPAAPQPPPDPRRIIQTAAEAGAVATNQFPPQQSHLDVARAKAAELLRQAGRGAGRLSGAAEQPFAWEAPPAAPADDGGPNMSQEPPELASMPKASYDTSSAQKLIARARGAAAGPKGAGGPDPAIADLRAKYAKMGGQAPGAPPEPSAAAETPAPGPGEAPTPPPMPPPEPGSEGGPLAALKSRLLSASADPRTEGLRAALAKAAEMKRVAGHITGMGIGADLALGTHVHGNQGKALEDQADDVVRQETMPAKFDNENRHADLEQAKGLQDLELRGNQDRRAAGAEGRANHADVRAQAAELRASRKGATEQDLSDPSSRVSQNMRAAAESLYAGTWNKIPQRIRDNYSAADVERIFKEISLKDFQKSGPSRAAGTEDRFEEKQVQDFNKNRITDRSVTAVNNLMGRLEDPSPIQGFDAAKGWAKSEKIPLLGGLLSGAGNTAVRGTEMEGIAQDALTIMQQISLDTSGKVLNEHEMQNIEKRLGLAAGQGEDAFRRAMKSEFDAIQSKADRDYESLSPGAREKVDQRKLRPTFKASSSTGYAPKENTALGERAKDTKSTLGELLDKAKSFF